MQAFFGLGHPLPFRIVGLIAATWGVLLAIAFALWLWGRADAYALAAIVTVEALLNLTMNHLLDVARPAGPGIVSYEQIPLDSFPSGHVFTATVVWGLLWARGRIPLSATMLVVTAVAISRLYLGVHYLGDVLAGALLGAVVVWGFQSAWPAVESRLRHLPYSVFVGCGVATCLAAVAAAPLLAAGNSSAWNALGVLTGGSAALLLEYRFIGYQPVAGAEGAVWRRLVVAFPITLVFLVIERTTGEGELALGLLLSALAALWALGGAPALFTWMTRREAAGRRIGSNADPG
ncbi:MAG: phosphatase PAP2 family protein [Gemmatimonadetes bacterium]|nr:phosphatase PAP2 family protein [Gemmatimonadota bacterium]